MFKALPPHLLTHILQLAVGPEQETYVGEGKNALCVPVVLGANSYICGLRAVCRAFHDVIKEVPLLVTASTTRQICSLAKISSWNIAAVQLSLSTDAVPARAAYNLPKRVRKKVVTVDTPGMSPHMYPTWLRQLQLDGLCHLIIHTVTNANDLCLLERLPHIQRLDLWDLSVDTPQLLVVLQLPMHVTSVVFFRTPLIGVCGMQQYKPRCVARAGAFAQAS